MKQWKVKLSSKDRNILKFLWKWKLATTAVLESRFYPTSKGQGAYKRMWRLARAGYVKWISTEDEAHKFWSLTSEGFDTIKESLSPLREEGFRSEHVRHDLYVTAFHLGDWACAEPSNVQSFSEQELRRIEPFHYPDWVPKTNLHRPDGYWLIQNGSEESTFAIEVELNQKAYEAIESVTNFYSEEGKDIDVLWIVGSQGQATKTHKKIISVLRSDSHNHSFLLLSDFLADGWQAVFIIGKYKGKSVSEIVGNLPEARRKIASKNLFFETQKMRVKSETNKTLDSIKFLIAGANAAPATK